MADKFYLILSGQCEVFINGKSVAKLNDLDVLGESALFPNTNGQAVRGATVTVVTPNTQLLWLSRQQFEDLVASGTLNEDCTLKLKAVAEERLLENEFAE